ncbi:potassium/proton antiporter [Bacillus sp. JCM 19034]|uniref:potassium/proton antiporter n=1 Tax=Bacillus sp. JCM 19034 TaxID=1481928 RepID=UPI00078119D8|nr:potassium/proton antiporter [Bacillus sp. JCM 19034]
MFFETLHTNTYVFIGALLLISGVLVAKFSSRLGLPALVLFILIGMLIGSDGLGFIYFDNPEVAQVIGIFALIIILFEGGMQTKFSTVKSVILPSVSLATLGVVFTSAIVGYFAFLLFDITLLEALLFGAIVGSTDAAAVFASLKERNIKAKMGATLEAESGTNDPMAVFLTLSFIELILTPETNLWGLIPSFFWQMGIGAIIGIAMGKFASYSINRIQLESSGLYPIFAISFALLTYSITSFIDGSGFLAVYVAALVIGNSELTYRYSIFQFHEGFAWMSQIIMFIILGLLVFPGQLMNFTVIVNGLILSVVLMILARPIAVFLSTIGMHYTLKEKLFISWAGLRGAVPIVLATFPVVAGLDNGQLFFNVVFFIVLTSALVQGSSISVVAKKLGLTGPKKATPHHSLELISMGKSNAEMVQYQVNDSSAIVGQKLRDIEFPTKVTISAIVRNEKLISPYGDTEVKDGDFLYILVATKNKHELIKILEKKNRSKRE